MGSDLYVPGMFPQRLAQYLSYMGSSAQESEILKFSFQFLSDGNDEELNELMGLVQKQDLKGTAVALRTGLA